MIRSIALSILFLAFLPALSACEKLPEPPREEQYGSLDELKSFLKAGNGDVSVTLSL